MRFFSITMVLIGALFLARSFIPARKIWVNVSGQLRRKWLLILILMNFFLLGYLLFDIVLFFNLTFPLEIVTGGVFLGGAVFVNIIINLSQYTIKATLKAEEAIKSLNESLEQRVAERTSELVRLSDFNRTVLDSIADPISILDVETLKIVDTNQAFLEEYSIYKEQIIGRTCYDVIHHRTDPCTPPHDSCPLVETLEHDNHASTLHVHWNNSGEKRFVEVITSPIRDEGGKIVQVIHTYRDITENKNSEEKLRDSRELLRSVIEGTSDAIYVKDLAGRYRLFNLAATRISGKISDEVVGRDDSFLYPEDEAKILMERDRAVIDSGQIMTHEEHLTSADGKHMTFLSTKGPLFDENGHVNGVFGIKRDITEQKKLEDERLEYERKFLHTQKLESLGILTGGIAHDFNNILTAIIGNMDFALLQLPADSPVREIIERSINACMRAADLTRQMLAYTGKGIFHLESINLNDIVIGNSDLFRTIIPRTIAMTINVGRNLPHIMGDPGQIQQVVMNLLTNAAEAVGSNLGEVILSTGIVDCDYAYIQKSWLEEKPSPGTFVYVEVSDNGCGMNDETKHKLFDPFFTTKFIGRGLGMAATQGIVRSNNGIILMESEEGRGTTFRILFPLPASKKELPVKEEYPQTTTEPLLADNKGCILVVDDEDSVRALVIEIIRLYGFKSLEASNGLEALDLYRQHHDDITCIILDLTMPVMDGKTTFNEIKKINPDALVILSSGHCEESAEELFTKDRPDAFIQKPFQVREMGKKIDTLLGAQVDKIANIDARANSPAPLEGSVG